MFQPRALPKGVPKTNGLQRTSLLPPYETGSLVAGMEHLELNAVIGFAGRKQPQKKNKEKLHVKGPICLDLP
jgi:hypothetical protein